MVVIVTNPIVMGVHLNWWNPIVMGLNPVDGNLGTLLAIPGINLDGGGKRGQQFKILTSTWVGFQIVLSFKFLKKRVF